MKHLLILLTSLFFASTTMYTMEIAKKSFGLEKKDYGLLECLYPEKDTDRLFPCFLATRDDTQLHRSINDDLLFAETMVARECLPKDITNKILATTYSVYCLEKQDHGETDKLLYQHLEITDKETFPLKRYQKNALEFLVTAAPRDFTLPNGTTKTMIAIEGVDTQFSLDIYSHLRSLPLSMREKITDKYKHVYVKTNETGLIEALLGECTEIRNKNINNIAWATGWLTTGICNIIMSSNIVDRVQDLITEPSAKEATFNSSVLVSSFGLTRLAGKVAESTVVNGFKVEKPKEILFNLGFEKKYLLTQREQTELDLKNYRKRT